MSNLDVKTDMFQLMIKNLSDDEQLWLTTRFVENKSLAETSQLLGVNHAPTYEQQIMRKLRRIPIQDQLVDTKTVSD